ncbi:uncharacterized protein [Chironomus tepperi]|uniref:uncharacterized protein n=1 Tax=Chironomus tepperi TaxID=113505 RepID=UPI00391F7F8C
MNTLSDDVWDMIFRYLDKEELWNVLIASPRWARIAGNSRPLMLHKLELTPEKFQALSSGGELSNVPFKNIVIKSFKGTDQLRKFSKILIHQKKSIELLDIDDFTRTTISEIIDFFKGFSNLIDLKLRNCLIYEEVHRQRLNPIPTLREIFFEKCDGNFFKIFHHQMSIVKVTIRNLDYTWSGFAHEDFIDLVKTLKNLEFIIFDGIGTGSFFDFHNFPFKIRKLDTCLISFHWYVGIKTARKKFLESQRGTLEELTIHNLPYDFDGGKLLKFIIEQMQLKTFYFGEIPLIIDGVKHPVTEFWANEIQICSLFEMFRQYPTIRRFKLMLSETDVDSREIEQIINPATNLFNNVEHFEVDDKSGYRCLLGLFLGLFKNFRNISSLKLQTPDRNINVLLQEFLPRMSSLKEIYIDSTAPRMEQRMNIIRNFVPALSKIWVDSEYVEDTRRFFGDNVEVLPTNN